jgi:hypothetical protein
VRRAAHALLVASLALAATRSARAQEEAAPDVSPALRRSAMANLHFLDLRLGAGAALEAGGTLGDRAGFHGTLGLTALSNEVLGGRLRALSLDVAWNEGTGRAVIAAELVRIDALVFGQDDEGICPAPILLVAPPGACHPRSGYVGLAGTLIGYQHDFASGRHALRVAEATLLLVPPAAGVEGAAGEGAFGDDWLVARFPFRLGASVDYAWALPTPTPPAAAPADAWLARADLGLDASLRLLDTRLELALSVDYRPRLDAWADDWGLEATLRVAYVDLYTLLRAQADLYRVGLEVGYAHWSVPAHGFGAAWSDRATDTGFVRVVLLPTVRNVP